MNIIHYLKQLLLKEDKAIIPGLGAFKTYYETASFDAKRNKLYPPVKKISFAFSESKKDDSLARFIAAQKDVDIKTVHKEIENYTSKIWRALNRGQRVNLDKVGTIYDKNDKIVFEFDESENYQATTSGFKAVDAIPLKSEKSESFKEKASLNKSKPFKPYTPPPSQRKEEKKSKNIQKKDAKPDIVKKTSNYPTIEEREKYFKSGESPAFTIFLFIVLIAIILVLMDPFYIGFIERTKPGLQPLIEHPEDKTSRINNLLSSGQSYYIGEQENIRQRSNETEEENTPEVVEETTVIEETTSPDEQTYSPMDPVPPTRQYHIIVASYNSLSLARKGIEKWEKRGYVVNIIGPAKNGYYRLSIGRYNNKTNAERDLRNVKNNVLSDAWLLKY